MRAKKTLMTAIACQLSTTVMQHLFWLVWPRYESSWGNSRTNSRSSTLMQLLFSFDQDKKMEKIPIRTILLVNSHKLSCNFCSRLIRANDYTENSDINSAWYHSDMHERFLVHAKKTTKSRKQTRRRKEFFIPTYILHNKLSLISVKKIKKQLLKIK